MKMAAVAALAASICSAASAETPPAMWEAARRDPIALADAIRAKQRLADSIAGARIQLLPSGRGATLRVELAMTPGDGLLRAEIAAFAALAWAFEPGSAKTDDDPIAEVDLVLTWPDDTYAEVLFPMRPIVAVPELAGILDLGAALVPPKAAFRLRDTCQQNDFRDPHFCSVVAAGK